jgi:hypothetical protein
VEWSFIIVALVGVISVAVANRLRLPWWWRVLVALLFAAVIVVPVYGLIQPPTLGGRQSWLDKVSETPFRELILFAMLLFGMVARVVSVAIEQRGVGEPVKIDRWQFVYPMLFAIPTFGGLLSQIQTRNLALADTVLAFQTGFFWQTILKKSEPT